MYEKCSKQRVSKSSLFSKKTFLKDESGLAFSGRKEIEINGGQHSQTYKFNTEFPLALKKVVVCISTEFTQSREVVGAAVITLLGA